MTEPKDTEVISREWVDMKIQASLKDYVNHEELNRQCDKNDAVFKELREKDEALSARINKAQVDLAKKLDSPDFWKIVLPVILSFVVALASSYIMLFADERCIKL